MTESLCCVFLLCCACTRCEADSPMTALGSVPNAHTQGEPEGTWNLEKLHLELKYLGRKLAEAKLQRGEGERAAGQIGAEGLAGALQVQE